MTRKLSALAFLLTCILVCQLVYSQSLSQKADSIIATVFTDKNGPGGVFMIAHDGKIIYQKSTGKANLELNVDMSTDHVFQLGSMTKQFTAVAVLLLEQEGKLKTSDPISTYIPNYPTKSTGSSFGFKTMGVYIPSEDIYVLGFSNCDCNSPTKVTTDIAALALQTLRKQK
ncbi:Beta-lactamase [Chitinophaga jiangningensis]|uniref:Beta-lactamase n=1 Tax=Chitinophaga jiangningensis TaxID=1419482 RepID=A0A1M7DKL9_9BACT|nr:serine hydrolase domain-containing protein [Chitinophaga jiangningensis]SHL79903.1 Beta-lactamase [Chitinophaga jiangningensis]